jgi:hypothetical protein
MEAVKNSKESHMIRKTLMAAAAAATLAAIGAPAMAQTIIVQSAPPAPRHEVMPGHRPGYVWSEGHWVWRGDQWTWARGHWVPERAGYAYVAPHWEQRDGRWVFVQETWRQDRFARGPGGRGWGDRDRDGIPNRYDRDRDGDGVRDRFDRFPNNPNRS